MVHQLLCATNFTFISYSVGFSFIRFNHTHFHCSLRAPKKKRCFFFYPFFGCMLETKVAFVSIYRKYCSRLFGSVLFFSIFISINQTKQTNTVIMVGLVYKFNFPYYADQHIYYVIEKTSTITRTKFHQIYSIYKFAYT